MSDEAEYASCIGKDKEANSIEDIPVLQRENKVLKQEKSENE